MSPTTVVALCLLQIVCSKSALAVPLPAGTEIQVRLRNRVASSSSKPKQPLDAVVIAPVMAGGRVVIPAGTTVHGFVTEAHPAEKADQRAVLALEFSELAGIKMNTKVTRVDNARETIDEKGRIIGILASQSLSSRIDQGIGKVAQKYADLAQILEAAKSAVLSPTEAEIVYEPGLELTLRLTAPLSPSRPLATDSGPRLEDIRNEADLIRLVNAQPFQTRAADPPKPSDLINLTFVGLQQAVEKAFRAAGWAAASELSAQSKLEVFRAVAEMRGYKEAPVSVLLLEDRPPDLVFQKQNNTFAQRHHVRIWRRPDTFEGQSVWVAAATHDVAIDFSQEERTFIHRIDSQIDRERAKIVTDLLFTNQVRSLAVVDRPEVPTASENATGDKIETDARMAVVILR